MAGVSSLPLTPTKILCSSTSRLSSNVHNTTLKLSFNPKKCILDGGIGLLASSVMALTPLDADATRIEYYATVADPPCEFNFVRSGLGYCDISVGSGEEAPYSELINIHYTARFADGRVFDSSYKRSRPLTMRIGVGKVIKGLDQGIYGGEGVPPMLVGGKRKLQIPPQLAYGPEPAGCFSGEVTAIYLAMQLLFTTLILLAFTRGIENEDGRYSVVRNYMRNSYRALFLDKIRTKKGKFASEHGSNNEAESRG